MNREPTKYLVARIRQALAEDERTNVLDLQISVAADKVFLLGWVDSPERRRAAEEVVREIAPPELTVKNELWIPSYDQPPQMEDLP